MLGQRTNQADPVGWAKSNPLIEMLAASLAGDLTHAEIRRARAGRIAREFAFVARPCCDAPCLHYVLPTSDL
jgi:hypothetical protein